MHLATIWCPFHIFRSTLSYLLCELIWFWSKTIHSSLGPHNDKMLSAYFPCQPSWWHIDCPILQNICNFCSLYRLWSKSRFHYVHLPAFIAISSFFRGIQTIFRIFTLNLWCYLSSMELLAWLQFFVLCRLAQSVQSTHFHHLSASSCWPWAIRTTLEGSSWSKAFRIFASASDHLSRYWKTCVFETLSPLATMIRLEASLSLKSCVLR